MAFDVKRFDIYRKVPKDLTQPTVTGAIISIFSCIFMLYLFLNELKEFLQTDVVSELFVDDNSSTESRIPVFLDITFPSMKCEYLGLDIVDDSQRHEVGVRSAIKTPENNDAGCRFKVHFDINKVPGNFHVSTHSSEQQPDIPNMRHTINSLTFGNDTTDNNGIIPGNYNNLGEHVQMSMIDQATHDYVLKIVPTIHETLNGKRFDYYQYTFAHKETLTLTMTGQILPAVYFKYDLNPITVRYTEKRQPLYNFLTSICAIIGGTFTVAGIIDSFIFTASEFYKKFELGKLS